MAEEAVEAEHLVKDLKSRRRQRKKAVRFLLFTLSLTFLDFLTAHLEFSKSVLARGWS